MEVSASENPATLGNAAEVVPPSEPGIPREPSNLPGEGVQPRDKGLGEVSKTPSPKNPFLMNP